MNRYNLTWLCLKATDPNNAWDLKTGLIHDDEIPETVLMKMWSCHSSHRRAWEYHKRQRCARESTYVSVTRRDQCRLLWGFEMRGSYCEANYSNCNQSSSAFQKLEQVVSKRAQMFHFISFTQTFIELFLWIRLPEGKGCPLSTFSEPSDVAKRVTRH